MAKKIEGSLVESDFDKGYVRFHEDENFGQDLATLVVHGDVFERVFTESEVRAAILDAMAVGFTADEKRNILREVHGITLDPA